MIPDNKGKDYPLGSNIIKAKIYDEGNWTQIEKYPSVAEGGDFTLFGSYAGLFEITIEYNSK